MLQATLREQAILENENILILTMGLPRSGKSTWARSSACPIVCPDAIRLAIHGQSFIATAESFVWATAHAMVAALFIAGHRIIILDACNNIIKRRKEWRSKQWTTFVKVFTTSREECLARANTAPNKDDLIRTINRMFEQHEPLQQDEKVWE